MASNADYTFQQVMNGIGSYNEAGNTGPRSEGVEQLQEYLTEIGYQFDYTSGFFLKETADAVRQFQYDCGISPNGEAGQEICKRLYVVHSSEYFKDYGWPLEESQWGPANILAGKFNNVDLLARIILAESGYNNTEDEKGVALVIKNRCDNSSSAYWESPEIYKNASIYARVIGKGIEKTLHYGTAKAGNETARCPRRGFHASQADGYINQAWKKAVDLAKDIVRGTQISVTGYIVHQKGDKLTMDVSSTLTVNTTNDKEYLNQKKWSSFEKNYWEGKVSAAVKPLAFSTSNDSNVIFKM